MSFDVAAEAYDRFMGRYSIPLAALFTDWVGVVPPAHALDVGCGPGALTTVLSDRLGAASVSAIDPSESFVAAARRRLPHVDVRIGSAEALPFADDSFDIVLAGLVVHLMTDAEAGVAEMVRTTRPGGIVAACVWDFAGGRAPHTAFFRAFASVDADVEDETARIGVGDGELVRLLEDAGCRNLEQGELTVSVISPTFAQWWEPYTLGVAPAGRQLAELDDGGRERVRREAHEMLGDGAVEITATAWAARGIAPSG